MINGVMSNTPVRKTLNSLLGSGRKNSRKIRVPGRIRTDEFLSTTVAFAHLRAHDIVESVVKRDAFSDESKSLDRRPVSP